MKLLIQTGFLALGDINFTSPPVMSQDGFDFVFTDVCVHSNILRRESGAEMDNNPLNVFRNGFALRHGGGGSSGEELVQLLIAYIS